MELSINVGYLRKQRGTDEPRDIIKCAELVKNAGFKYLDFGVTAFIQNDNWEEYLTKVKSKLDSMELIVDQTHAPFVYKNFTEEEYKSLMMDAFKASKLMGAKNVVIHADKYIPDENGFDFDKALNTVYDFYAPYVEYAVKNGLGVAVENLFDVNKDPKSKDRNRFSSYVEEQIAIIDKFNDPLVTACWDVGHGNVSYGYDDSVEAMKKLGSRLTSTHVHDNIYRSDLHSPIFLGSTKWEELIKALKEMNYPGKFTFELVYGIIPEELIQKYMNLYYETGKFVLENY